MTEDFKESMAILLANTHEDILSTVHNTQQFLWPGQLFSIISELFYALLLMTDDVTVLCLCDLFANLPGNPTACPSIHLFTHLQCLFGHLSACLSTNRFACPSVYPTICLSSHLSSYLSGILSEIVCLSIYICWRMCSMKGLTLCWKQWWSTNL